MTVKTLPCSPGLRIWVNPQGLWETKRLSIPCVEPPISILRSEFLKRVQRECETESRVDEKQNSDQQILQQSFQGTLAM